MRFLRQRWRWKWLRAGCALLLCLGFITPAARAASGALQFDGVNDYVTFGPAPGLGLSAFTLEAWVKRLGAGLASSSGGGGVVAVPLITKGRGEADGSNLDCNYFFGLRSTDFVLAADFEEGAAGASPGLNHPIYGATVLATGVWYHVAATYDGTNWALYLNGQLEAQLNVGRPLRYDSIQHAALAAALQSTGTPEGAFAGIMDEVRIWNYARSISQIASNQNMQLASAAGLVGRWSLDEGSGGLATNTGSSSINGILTNGPGWVAGYPFEMPPTVALTNPPTGAVATNPTNVLLEVSATDPDGSVTNVCYLFGTNLIGRAATAPFTLLWTNPPVGIHSLAAIATDNSGLSATSAPVSITVHDEIVHLTAPTNGARFLAPASVTLTAEALETNGPVTQVEFFAGSTSLGAVAVPPWTTTWNVTLLGAYSLTTVATDGGGMHTSAPINLVIGTDAAPSNQFPAVVLVSPTNNSTILSGSNLTVTANATDSDGAVINVEFFLDGFKVAADTASPYSFVWSNAPLGSYTLAARATDNLGSNTWSAPVAVTVALSPTGTNTLVAQGSAWRYLDSGVDQGTAWRAANFDDSTWPIGLAQLGYGDGDEATVVGFGPDANNRYITTWFRRAWVVSDPAAFNSLQLRLLRDDGAVVYINGVEVARQNMPAGTILASTLASTAVAGADENTFFPSTVSAAGLLAGTNVLAVEIHQSSASSSDISFDLQLIGLSGSAGLPALTRGPYLQNATTNSIVLRWRTDAATNSVVRFGTNAASLNQVFSDAALLTEHSITVSNLAADTKYFYALTLGANTLAGATTNHFFTTLAVPGVARPTRLWVLGDSGTAGASAQSVRNAYLNLITTNRAADIWLMLGDNAYNSGLDAEYQSAVFDMYPTVLRNTTLWSTIGNHETAQQTTISSFSYLDLFTLPQAGEAGGLASGTERYYSFDYANIHFLCLDAMTSGRTTNTPMFDWVRADLASSTQEWVIAFWHHPPYTKGSHNSDTENDLIQIRSNWLPALEDLGVDLVLSGHSHCYERSTLMSGHYGLSSTFNAAMRLDSGDGRISGAGPYLKSTGTGTVYTVAGNGGQATGGSLNHPAMFLSLNELGSLVIDVNSNRLDVQMLGPTAVRDTFTIIKQPAPTPSFDRFAQQGFKARRGKFLQNGYSALTNAGPASAGGGSAAVAKDWVFYAPPSGYNAPDSFPFAVTNSFGKSATGTARVNLAADNAPSQNVTVEDLGNGSFRLRCSGIPGRSYSIQFSNDLGNPVWQPLAIGSADAHGVFERIDTPPYGTRFYRTTYP